ncbi:MAG: translation initiation factor IF-3 [Clostridiales bacterium]|nr:translation initiation factor IF-3 [Clostridiales bacterium]
MNDDIRDKEVRLIDSDGTMLGVVPTKQAMELAVSKNLDLVKIVPNAVPPVCKITDYNKSLYEQSKKDKEAKKNQKVVSLKEIRLSAGIEDHDMEFKAKNAYKFLQDGDKVKVSIRFKGREMKYTSSGQEVLTKFADNLKEVGTLDRMPKLEGRVMSMIMIPKKAVTP